MKKNVIIGLVIMLVVGVAFVFVGCPKGDDTPFDPSGGKVVAEQYRGTYKDANNTKEYKITENRFEEWGVGATAEYTYTAWTEDTELWIHGAKNKFIADGGDTLTTFKIGSFEDTKLKLESTFSIESKEYTKQP